jgi:hypothetical protein
LEENIFPDEYSLAEKEDVLLRQQGRRVSLNNFHKLLAWNRREQIYVLLTAEQRTN